MVAHPCRRARLSERKDTTRVRRLGSSCLRAGQFLRFAIHSFRPIVFRCVGLASSIPCDFDSPEALRRLSPSSANTPARSAIVRLSCFLQRLESRGVACFVPSRYPLGPPSVIFRCRVDKCNRLLERPDVIRDVRLKAPHPRPGEGRVDSGGNGGVHSAPGRLQRPAPCP